MDVIDEVRSFNRFYTRQIGLLDEHLPASDFSLAEARVLYELARSDDQTAAGVARTLAMDKAHLSRILARFTARGLVDSRVSPGHRKHRLLSLTAAGRDAFAALDQGTRLQMSAILSPIGDAARNRLVAAMKDVRTALSAQPSGGEVTLRSLRVGDIGWITHRQAILYAEEYGWDWTYEGLVAEILGAFAANFDREREDAWVAEHDGATVGSIFLMRGEEPGVAKLRLLYVEPASRGLGVGGKLVAACIERARALGYSRMTLWTNDILSSARRIYQREGFTLASETPHRSFGHDLVGQTWALDL